MMTVVMMMTIIPAKVIFYFAVFNFIDFVRFI